MYAHKVCADGDYVRVKSSIQEQRLTFKNLNHCKVKINKNF